MDFIFHYTNTESLCFLTETFVFGSLIVGKIAALKGNYFIPNVVNKTVVNVGTIEKKNNMAGVLYVYEGRCCPLVCPHVYGHHRVVLDVIHSSIQLLVCPV